MGKTFEIGALALIGVAAYLLYKRVGEGQPIEKTVELAVKGIGEMTRQGAVDTFSPWESEHTYNALYPVYQAGFNFGTYLDQRYHAVQNWGKGMWQGATSWLGGLVR